MIARFRWWDDAVNHATWLAGRNGVRHRVYAAGGLWCVRVQVVKV